MLVGGYKVRFLNIFCLTYILEYDSVLPICDGMYLLSVNCITDMGRGCMWVEGGLAVFEQF